MNHLKYILPLILTTGMHLTCVSQTDTIELSKSFFISEFVPWELNADTVGVNKYVRRESYLELKNHLKKYANEDVKFTFEIHTDVRGS